MVRYKSNIYIYIYIYTIEKVFITYKFFFFFFFLHNRQDEGIPATLLIQAVRSYLHFSQISSWLYSAGGKLHGLLVYRWVVGSRSSWFCLWLCQGGIKVEGRTLYCSILHQRVLRSRPLITLQRKSVVRSRSKILFIQCKVLL